MTNKFSSFKFILLVTALASAVMESTAHADVIFSDDFSEFYPLSPNTYTDNSIPGYTSSLNQIAWTPIGSGYGDYAYGLSTISVDYGSSAGETTPLYVYLANYAGGVQTSVLTNTGSAVYLNTAASYTLSFDLGNKGSYQTNDTVVELLAGSTVVGTQTYDPTSLTSGQFTAESFTIPSASLVGDSGALSIAVLNNDTTNPGFHTDFTNVQLSDSTTAVPEPNSIALTLLGLCVLLFVQRIRRQGTLV